MRLCATCRTQERYRACPAARGSTPSPRRGKTPGPTAAGSGDAWPSPASPGATPLKLSEYRITAPEHALHRDVVAAGALEARDVPGVDDLVSLRPDQEQAAVGIAARRALDLAPRGASSSARSRSNISSGPAPGSRPAPDAARTASATTRWQRRWVLARDIVCGTVIEQRQSPGMPCRRRHRPRRPTCRLRPAPSRRRSTFRWEMKPLQRFGCSTRNSPASCISAMVSFAIRLSFSPFDARARSAGISARARAIISAAVGVSVLASIGAPRWRGFYVSSSTVLKFAGMTISASRTPPNGMAGGACDPLPVGRLRSQGRVQGTSPRSRVPDDLRAEGLDGVELRRTRHAHDEGRRRLVPAAQHQATRCSTIRPTARCWRSSCRRTSRPSSSRRRSRASGALPDGRQDAMPTAAEMIARARAMIPALARARAAGRAATGGCAKETIAEMQAAGLSACCSPSAGAASSWTSAPI